MSISVLTIITIGAFLLSAGIISFWLRCNQLQQRLNHTIEQLNSINLRVDSLDDMHASVRGIAQGTTRKHGDDYRE